MSASDIRTTCNCKSCSLKGMALCEQRKFSDCINNLRTALLVNNIFLADIIDSMRRHKLTDEERIIFDLIKDNSKVLSQTTE